MKADLATLGISATGCRNLEAAEAAVSVDPAGRERPITVHLCNWPHHHRRELAAAPRWLQRLVGPGLAIDPQRDCIGCPGFSSEVPNR